MAQLLLEIAFPFFENAARTELAESGWLRSYKKDDLLLGYGEKVGSTFFILKGLVKACRPGTSDSKFVLFYVKPGQSFGLSVTAEDDDSTHASIASFVATENTQVLVLSLEEKDRLAKKYDSIYRYILKTAITNYGFYTTLIDNIAFQQLDTRIEYFLSRLSEAKNKTILKISHQEIADGLHASRESVSRLLKKMEEMGKIKLGHNQISLENLSV